MPPPNHKWSGQPLSHGLKQNCPHERKFDEPVREFERQNSYCALHMVWRSLGRQIDALVYDLYALTPAEINIVEESPTNQH
jgi:hypothetical protein